jgi:hypothetical protein
MVTPATTTTTVSRAGKLEKSLGSVEMDCGNGTDLFRNIHFTVIEIPYDLIIGRNYFQMFGFVLSGLPVKKPGPQVTVTNELVPPISVEDIAAPPVMDPRLIEALKRNAAIHPSKEPCTNPLAYGRRTSPRSPATIQELTMLKSVRRKR